MRVKEFIYLAMLLLVGLLVNHCAFDNDVTNFSTSGEFEKIDQRLQDSVDKFDQHMEKAREIEQKMERLDDRLEKAGERIEGSLENGGVEKSTQVPSADGKLNISVIYKLPGEDYTTDSLMFMEIPSDLMLTLGAAEVGKLALNMWGGSGMKSPNFTANDNGRVSIGLADGDMPDKADATLPGEITEITFGADEAMLLMLEPSGAVLHLDSAMENITIKRSGEWVTLTSPDWAVRIKGLKPDMKVIGADGNDLGELKAVGTTEITYTAPKDGEGGAQ